MFQIEVFVSGWKPPVGSAGNSGHVRQPESSKSERQRAGEFAAGHRQSQSPENVDVAQKQTPYTAHRNHFIEVPLRGKYIF